MERMHGEAEPLEGHRGLADGRALRGPRGRGLGRRAPRTPLARRRAVAGRRCQPQAGRGPLSVLGTSPTAGATGVASSATVTVELSTPLAPAAPCPPSRRRSPAAGTGSPRRPAVLGGRPLRPGDQREPGHPRRAASACSPPTASVCRQTVTVPFTVAPGSTLRLQQLLAQLGYLPVAFAPTTPTAPTQEAEVQAGTFTWRWAALPSALDLAVGARHIRGDHQGARSCGSRQPTH